MSRVKGTHEQNEVPRAKEVPMSRVKGTHEQSEGYP